MYEVTLSLDAKSLPERFKDANYFVHELRDVYQDAHALSILKQLGQPSRFSFWLNPFNAAGPSTSAAGPSGTASWTRLPPNLAALADVQTVPELPGVWSAPRASEITRSEAANSAAIYIQNPSSLVAVKALAPQPHEEVLDLAAAPGGKTIALSVAMDNTGRIAAVEAVKSRYFRLQANVQRCGVTNVDFYLRDGRGVGRAVGERFDRVLLDAPCSSQARMRWFDERSYGHWTVKKNKEAQRKQKRLILSAYDALKPGGRLVYCTCSFSVTENESVVHHLLTRSDAHMVPLSMALPEHLPGLSRWRGKSLSAELVHSVRILPNPVWDGFYLAVLAKPG